MSKANQPTRPIRKITAVSLFSSGGIGDLALREHGADILVSNEILEDRHSIYSHNFPSTRAITGDIWAIKDKIIDAATEALGGIPLDMVYATPPCQGMSKNGRGKLLAEIRKGNRPDMDQRNRLIIPTMDIICALRPHTVVFENVPEMLDTIIMDEKGVAINVVDYVKRRLGDQYVGTPAIVDFANYGVPQNRRRLITIFSKHADAVTWYKDCGKLISDPTHNKNGTEGLKKWMTVRDAIEKAPPLDARAEATAEHPTIPFHRVPLLDKDKYFWVENTGPERSAFDNQCVKCDFQKNPRHIAAHDDEGINRSSKTTPIRCRNCGALLPRPWVVEAHGGHRLMSGFTSAYKRMGWDWPASALTRNLSYACSDNKLHPSQNRVLSLHEAFIIHTVNQFYFEWVRKDKRRVSDKTIRETIGESIPPMGLYHVLGDVFLAIKPTKQGTL